MKRLKGDLPPNPYTRKPITKSTRLGGRSAELESIDYYLHLTASGDSPHLALIGPRGVGKTSLLNAVAKRAQDKSLLVVRVDLDERKTSAPGIFWQDFYATLLLAAGEAGCWGGVGGALYTTLFLMINARVKPEPESIVLQFPVVLASTSAPLEALNAPDSLVLHDLRATGSELGRHGYKGIAVLIDEADCLGQNRPLMQMFRNIFQRLDACSLVLAGTEAVFPTLTQVFSPIPRQFHRIDVEPFANWSDTEELVLRPFGEAAYAPFRDIAPAYGTIHDLHVLCGGDPAELQLYCHHMYRLVEGGVMPVMSLVPEVFREVVREYRANVPADLGHILERIQNLPPRLLFESGWLRFRRLSVQENINAMSLQFELGQEASPPEEVLRRIATEIAEGYAALYEQGITTSPERLDFIGGEFTAGFWKSYVKAERRESVAWIDAEVDDCLSVAALSALGQRSGWPEFWRCDEVGDGIAALMALRSGDSVTERQAQGMWELRLARRRAAKEDIQVGPVTSVDVVISFQGREQKWRLFYPRVGKPGDVDGQMTAWLSDKQPTLARYGVSAAVERIQCWAVPTNEEMQRLAYIAGASLPADEFGETLPACAFGKFKGGDIGGASALFEWMMIARPNNWARNCVGYCGIVSGDYSGAAIALGSIDATRRDASWELYQYNRAVLAWLKGDKETACGRLREVWAWVVEQGERYDPRGPECMLVIDSASGSAASRDNLPVDAAIQLNLFAMGLIQHEELVGWLSERYPDRHGEWLRWVTSGAAPGT